MYIKPINGILNKLEEEEKEAIEIVESVLFKMQKYFLENAKLTSPSTGEVVEISELSRVIGILSCIAENDVFFVKLKEEEE